jgi:hypothetical protein
MNKLLKYTIPAIIVGLVIAAAVSAQVSPPNYLRKLGSNVYVFPNTTSTTLGTSTGNGAFNNLTISGTCTGCLTGSTGTSTINGVTGPTFTFSIVNTSSASSITTSSAQVFLNLLTLSSSSQITISSTGTIIFATTSVSQFVNDKGYLTSAVTSFNGATGTVSGVNSYNGATGTVTGPTLVSNTFSGVNTFNGTTTFTSASTSFTNGFTAYGLSFVTGQLQSYFYFPTPAQLTAGTTCGTTTGVTEVGNCWNDIYAYGSTLGSSTAAIVGCYNYPSSTFTNPAFFGTNNERMQIQGCSGGGSVFNYGGAQGTYAFQFDFGPTSGSSQKQIKLIDGISLRGTNTTTTNPMVGIVLGGNNGAAQSDVEDLDVQGFGIGGIASGSYYGSSINNSIFRNNGQNFVINVYQNSGEADTFSSVWMTDQANGTSSNCFVVNTVEVFHMIGGARDNCHATYLIGALNAAEYSVSHEDTAGTINGGAPMTVASSSNFADFASTYYNDATTTAGTGPGFIELSGTAKASLHGTVFSRTSAATSTPSAVLEDTGFTGSVTIDGVNNGGAGQPAGVTAVIQGDTGSNYVQFGGNSTKGYSGGILFDGGNFMKFMNGNATVGLVDQNGKWLLGSNGSGLSTNGRAASTTVQVLATNTSTLMIGAVGKTSCFEMTDPNATATIYYMYPTAGVFTVTSTKPAWCL